MKRSVIHRLKIILSLLSVSILISYESCFSQSFFSTTNGYVFVTGMYKDSAFFAESHKLAIVYNQNEQSIYGQMNLQTFTSGVPFIDSILNEKSAQITINGQIPVDFLTWDHSEYNLEVPLEIEINDMKIITISKMTFNHSDKLMNYTCIMESAFNLNLSDFVKELPEQLGPEINIQFLQLILRRKNK